MPVCHDVLVGLWKQNTKGLVGCRGNNMCLESLLSPVKSTHQCSKGSFPPTYVPVHGNGQETEDGTHKGHTQQGVYDVVQPHLGDAALLQVAHVGEGEHEVLEGFGGAGDGVEGGEAADEAVHGHVQVPVAQDGHHDQQVLRQAHGADGEEDRERDDNLGAVCLI